MDNLTHSLIGIAFARGAVRYRDADEESVAVAAGVWASNLADLDSVTAFAGGKLEYLLQHRGYTHTVVAAPALAAVGLGLAVLSGGARARGAVSPRTAWVALGAALLHLVADGLNDYGVHPFWPLWNRWLYGDTIFIIEPLLLAVLLPYAIATARSRVGRWMLTGLAGAGLILLWVQSFVVAASAAVVTAIGMSLYVAHRRGLGRPCFEAVGLIVLAFAVGHRLAADRMLGTPADDERVLAVSTTPAPGNPLCWRAELATLAHGSQYVVREASLSLWPAVVSPDTCDRLHREHGMPQRSAAASSAPDIVWSQGYQTTLEELEQARRQHCRFGDLVHFARLPFLSGHLAGDLRYDSGDGESFATIDLDGPCPAAPPWTPPLDAATRS